MLENTASMALRIPTCKYPDLEEMFSQLLQVEQLLIVILTVHRVCARQVRLMIPTIVLLASDLMSLRMHMVSLIVIPMKLRNLHRQQ
jgi:hypothetical protein